MLCFKSIAHLSIFLTLFKQDPFNKLSKTNFKRHHFVLISSAEIVRHYDVTPTFSPEYERVGRIESESRVDHHHRLLATADCFVYPAELLVICC